LERSIKPFDRLLFASICKVTKSTTIHLFNHTPINCLVFCTWFKHYERRTRRRWRGITGEEK